MLKTRLLKILRAKTIIAPVPSDQLAQLVGVTGVTAKQKVHEALNRLLEEGYVKYRLCPDSRYYREYWLAERAQELIFLP